jgi:hypothetical protein
MKCALAVKADISLPPFFQDLEEVDFHNHN